MRLLILSSVLSLAMAGGALAATEAAAPAAAKAAPAKPGFMAKMTAARTAKAKKPAATPMAAAPATSSTMAAKPMATTGAHKGGTPVAQRSAISISCSKQADTKGLHGKDREKFRRGCMKG